MQVRAADRRETAPRRSRPSAHAASRTRPRRPAPRSPARHARRRAPRWQVDLRPGSSRNRRSDFRAVARIARGAHAGRAAGGATARSRATSSRMRARREVDLRLGREPTEAEPQRALRQLIVAAERAQHVGRLAVRRRAGRAGRQRQVRQREEQALALDAVEGDVQDAGHAPHRVAVQHDAPQRRSRCQSRSRSAGDARGVGGHLVARRSRQATPMPDDLMRRQRARAQAALLAAAELQRHEAEPRLAPDAQRADALGSVHLVRRERRAGRCSRARTSSGSLPALCAASTWSSTPRSRHRCADRGHVLHDAGLVVHVHQRHEQRVAAQRRRDLLRLARCRRRPG